jgi:hypothetical protein
VASSGVQKLTTSTSQLSISGKASQDGRTYLFMTAKRPYRETSKSAIYTLTEDLIFVDETYERTSDFKHQTYRNREYLTFSRSFSTGVSNPGHGYGKTVFLDYEYQSSEVDFFEPIL